MMKMMMMMTMMMVTTTIKRGLSSNQNIKTINRKAKVIQMQGAVYRSKNSNTSHLTFNAECIKHQSKTYCRKGGTVDETSTRDAEY
jgi:hypothetical protein